MAEDYPDDYLGSPEPKSHGYNSYRGWIKTCPPNCECPDTLRMRASWQGSAGAYSNEYD